MNILDDYPEIDWTCAPDPHEQRGAEVAAVCGQLRVLQEKPAFGGE